MQQVAQVSIMVLSFIVLIGGVIGFKKAKSKASLIAGVISATLLDICFAVTFMNPQAGFIAAIVVAGMLDVVFVMRLMKTQKFMPSGMVLLCCLGTQGVLLKALF